MLNSVVAHVLQCDLDVSLANVLKQYSCLCWLSHFCSLLLNTHLNSDTFLTTEQISEVYEQF